MSGKRSVAVVTGGADGIGLATALKLRERVAAVVIADVDSEKTLAQADRHGLTGVACDVRSEADLARLASTASAIGDVSFVMANAGVAAGGRFECVPTEEWQRVFDVNVHGVVRTINAFLPGMMERGCGRVVVTGSSAGLFSSDGLNVPYAASKHALLTVAQGLQNYCQKLGIKVHYLAPRLTDTEFPRAAVAWGRRGSWVSEDRSIGDDFDTVDKVVDVLLRGIEEDRFLISLTAETERRMKDELSLMC